MIQADETCKFDPIFTLLIAVKVISLRFINNIIFRATIYYLMLSGRILNSGRVATSCGNKWVSSSSRLRSSSHYFSTIVSESVGPLTFYPAPSSDQSSTKKVNKAALLSGWTDGSERHLSNYVKIYHSLGVDVYLMTSQSRDFVVSSRLINSFHQHQNALIDHFKKSRLLEGDELSHLKNGGQHGSHVGKQELIIHCFSNGGLLSLYYMSTSFPRFHELKVSHIVLDSCPGGHLLSPMSYVRALTTKITNPALKALASGIVYLFATLDILAMKIAKGNYKSFVIKIRELLLDTPSLLAAPALFLYSNGDIIVLPQDIEIFAGIRKRYLLQPKPQLSGSNSSPVVGNSNHLEERVQILHNFGDSAHVLHYRQYPEKYTSLIHEFVHSYPTLNSK